jgi:acyl-CoA dehydrogenase
LDFEYSQDQQQIAEAIRGLCSRFDDDYWLEHDRDHAFPWEFYRAMAEGGWLGTAIPTESGGGGLGITEAAIILREIAASGAAMNGCSALHLTLFGTNIIVKHGSKAMRDDVIPRVISGDLHVCFAVTEPDAGTDTTSIRTFAQRDGDDFVINGRKLWITKALESEKMILVTRTTKLEDCERRTDGLTIFLVDLDQPGIEVRPIEKFGRNAVASTEVFLDDVRVPSSRVIGDVDKGFRQLLDGLNPERILLAFESIGIGRVALDRAVAYANQRVVFGRPIGQNQGIAFPLAESLARLDSAELLALKAAWLYDRGQPCAREANSAKYLCADAAFQAADRAMQTHGGLGYAREYHVERYFREARLMRIAPISQEMVLNYLSEHALGLPRSY